MESYPQPPEPSDREHEPNPAEFLEEFAEMLQVPRPEAEQFAGLPNRREALRAKDANNTTVFLYHAIAKKLYRCPCCHGDIPIGDEHVIMSRVQASKTYDHHHLDFPCTIERILPSLSQIKTIKAREASMVAINKRSRKLRYRRRH